MTWFHRDHRKKMYVPWFPSGDSNSDFLTYIHQGLHHELGEDVGFPDSEWSYTRNDSPFDNQKESDERIHYKVLDALYRNKDIDASQVNVLVHNAVVNLSGTVKSEREKAAAENCIRELKEVWNVENEISVDSGIKQKSFVLPGFS